MDFDLDLIFFTHLGSRRAAFSRDWRRKDLFFVFFGSHFRVSVDFRLGFSSLLVKLYIGYVYLTYRVIVDPAFLLCK
jgi:hypothetical protein